MSERVKQVVLHDDDGVLGDVPVSVLLGSEVPDVLERVGVGRGGGAFPYDSFEQFGVCSYSCGDFYINEVS